MQIHHVHRLNQEIIIKPERKETSNETKNNQSDSANSDADDKTTEERGLEQDCGKREAVVTTFEKVTLTDALGQQIDFE